MSSFRIAPNLKIGLANSWEVEPPLPPGMAIDAQTGLISGCPILREGPIERKMSFIVYASNSVGTCSCGISMQISTGAWDLVLIQISTVESSQLSSCALNELPQQEKMEWGNFHERWSHKILHQNAALPAIDASPKAQMLSSDNERSTCQQFVDLQGLWKNRLNRDAIIEGRKAKMMEQWGVKTCHFK
eukprot:gnl/MRDRNA2_/MRDRNA2_145302_c0_seq1.p1 gnl/MRDRNA2_/MRDRNA2_145302_c0~~gnl/MRDRNA2_/MRDRNA2_145302_c0_seq1.p1  ORF type:complete len:200 (+),score=30.40 gnl/MRDRNA2_/MRDRNA2_145302_c0_seq1:37-600(+)